MRNANSGDGLSTAVNFPQEGLLMVVEYHRVKRMTHKCSKCPCFSAMSGAEDL